MIRSCAGQTKACFSGGSGKLPTKGLLRQPERPLRTRSIHAGEQLRERFGRHARVAAGCLRKVFTRWPSFALSWPAHARRARYRRERVHGAACGRVRGLTV